MKPTDYIRPQMIPLTGRDILKFKYEDRTCHNCCAVINPSQEETKEACEFFYPMKGEFNMCECGHYDFCHEGYIEPRNDDAPYIPDEYFINRYQSMFR